MTKVFSVRRHFGAAATIAALAIGQSALADESLPAVSEPNAKITGAGGALDTVSVYVLEGSFTTPIAHSFGLQVDGIAGLFDDDGLGGGAAHLFWRDPAIGMVGLYGSGFATTAGRNYSVANVGIEGSLYLDRFTVEGIVGAQFASVLDTDIFGTALLAYYPIDDLRVHGGYRYWFGKHIGMAGFEWQFPGQNDNSINFGLFGDAQFREESVGAWAGFRIYFGSQKPLIRRHREDDPVPILPFDINLFTPPAGGGAGGGSQEPPDEEEVNCEDYYEYGYFSESTTNLRVANVENSVRMKIPEECLF